MPLVLFSIIWGGCCYNLQSTTTAEDSTIWQQQADGVIGPRHGLGSQCPPSLGGRVEDLGEKNGISIGKDDGPVLAARDEDLPVGEHDCVGEPAWVRHGGHFLDGRRQAWLGDGGDVGPRGGGRVGVRLGAPGAEDLARLVHGVDAAHAVLLPVADAGVGLGAGAGCCVPVLVLAGTGLEDSTYMFCCRQSSLPT